jgi:exonuclease III
MPYYKPVFDALRDSGDLDGARRLAEGLLRLRGQLRRDLPPRNVTDSILVATWNIRELGGNDKFGPRLNSSLLYIAEILSCFDLIAVQEVKGDLTDLRRVRTLLGDWWDYIVTDITEGRSGNDERIAFLYDCRKVRFDHLAGEVVLPSKKDKNVLQPARSPFICAFRSGWRRISLCSVHIYYGTADPNNKRRVEEIGDIAQLLAARNARRQNDADGEPENIIMLGDFNIFNKTGDKTTAALEANDFVIPKTIRAIPGGGNLAQDKYYDQMAFHDPKSQLRPTAKAGVFVFTNSIFGIGKTEDYDADMRATIPDKYEKAKNKNKLYNQWRTFQLSDHYPLWIELKTNFSDGFLATIMRANKLKSTSRK